MTGVNALEVRILIVAPRGRDAALIAATLSEDDLSPVICADTEALSQRLKEGAAAVMIAEEALGAEALESMTTFLAAQPPWSDIPIVVLTHSGRPSLATTRRAR